MSPFPPVVADSGTTARDILERRESRGPLVLATHGGHQICLPASLDRLSTYVFAEQEDWFESELSFVRGFLGTSMRAIDIGASYGAYTLAMAKAVGPTGTVWSFEPSAATASFLRRSLSINRLANVQLIEAAISHRAGRATLRVHGESELNSLTVGSDSSGTQVDLTTLDAWAAAHGWPDIDLVKIDAEGEEANVLVGGDAFLARASPLVLFEVIHAGQPNRRLVDAFGARGYRTYRLLPGINVLVAIEPDDQDLRDLNLFACKADRAALLAQRGLLADETARPPRGRDGSGLDHLRSLAFFAPIEAQLRPAPDKVDDPDRRRHGEALDLYALAKDESATADIRAAALGESQSMLFDLCTRAANLPRVLSLARVHWEAGWRADAASALERLARLLRSGRSLPIEEPFLPPSPRFDSIAPSGDLAHWALASIIEQFEVSRVMSSYFTEPETLEMLDWLMTTRFASAPMARRRFLMRWRNRLPIIDAVDATLTRGGSDHLNAWLWRGMRHA